MPRHEETVEQGDVQGVGEMGGGEEGGGGDDGRGVEVDGRLVRGSKEVR